MKLDPGLAVVIVAVLIFYLRIIILQRERVKRAARPPEPLANKKKKKEARQPGLVDRYSILSRKPADLVIAGVGLLAILIGVMLNAHWIALPVVQSYWWLPTAAGIVAFSWAFKL